MRRPLMAILFLSCLALLPIPPATAQPTRWTGLEGSFALTMPQGWQYSTDESVSTDAVGEVLLVTRRRSQTAAPRDSASCVVGRIPWNTSTDYIATKLDRMARDEAISSDAVKYTVISRVLSINGTPALDYERKTKGPLADGSTDRSRVFRTFSLDRSGQTFEVLISCEKPREASEATLKEINAFINSLEIDQN